MTHISVAPATAPEPLLTAQWVVGTNAPLFTDTSHCQANGAEPVVGIFPVTVSIWFRSSAGRFTVGAWGAVSAVDTVTVAELAEVCVSAAVALSVTVSSKA